MKDAALYDLNKAPQARRQHDHAATRENLYLPSERSMFRKAQEAPLPACGSNI
jgi:hypothetical protein